MFRMTSECCAVDRIGFDPLTFGPLGSLSGGNPGGENNNVVPQNLVTSGCCRARALAEVEGYSWIPTVSTYYICISIPCVNLKSTKLVFMSFEKLFRRSVRAQIF